MYEWGIIHNIPIVSISSISLVVCLLTYHYPITEQCLFSVGLMFAMDCWFNGYTFNFQNRVIPVYIRAGSHEIVVVFKFTSVSFLFCTNGYYCFIWNEIEIIEFFTVNAKLDQRFVVGLNLLITGSRDYNWFRNQMLNQLS